MCIRDRHCPERRGPQGLRRGLRRSVQAADGHLYAGPPAPSAWAKALLEDADSKGLITQRTRGIYQDPITRLQFAELAVNMIEKATGKSIAPAENTFHDTSDTMALKAVAAGVAAGKGEGKFAPDAAITRQEICVMLNRAIEYRCV